jgi:hypothetical protein
MNVFDEISKVLGRSVSSLSELTDSEIRRITTEGIIDGVYNNKPGRNDENGQSTYWDGKKWEPVP